MRRLGLSAAVALLVFVGAVTPAHADDLPNPPAVEPTTSPTEPAPEPTPVPTTDPTPVPTPETTPEPTPEPTTSTPATPPAPRASRLPLREGARGWRVAKVQERLQWLGYEIYAGNLDRERMGESTSSAVRRFQVKHGMRPTGVVGSGTWERLAEVTGRVGWLPRACLGELTLCIDKSQRLVRLVDRKGRVLESFDARFGMPGAETDEGTFRVHMKSRNHTSSLYRTWMPFALFYNGDEAVHYSPYFARDGYYGGSHGCVNLREFDGAERLFDRVPLGTRVHVYWS